MKYSDCLSLKCFTRLCIGHNNCPLRDYNLARIKAACIKTKPGVKTEKEEYKGKWPNIHVKPPDLFPPSGWIGMRQVKYNFENLKPEQALEIMNNGDCGEM
jgi:hypothetical protein